MDILEILKNIGLTANEAKIYSAVLDLKKGLITPIANKAHVNRTTAYDVLEYLNEKGLVLKYVENGKIGYTTEGPQRLRNWLTQKENQLDLQKDVFRQNLPELKSVFYTKESQPRFKYFEGVGSMGGFFQDALECLSGENIGYASAHLTTQNNDDVFIKKYVKARVGKKIKARYFVQESGRGEVVKYLEKYYKKYLIKYPDLLRIKVLPTKNRKYFINETAIYDNKFAVSHLEKDFFGVIIEDKAVADTQRMIFDVLWGANKDEIKI